MDKVTRLYLKAAEVLKLPFVYQPAYKGIEICLAGKKYFFRGGLTPYNDAASADIAANKYCMNRLLQAAGFPLPKATVVSRKTYKAGAWFLPEDITYPLVAKPTLYGYAGLDVFCNIKNASILAEYLEEKFSEHKFITIEEFHGGLTAYRVVVFFNKVISVVRRDPAAVIGDGRHTLAELIAIANTERAKNTTVSLGELKVDREYQTKLKEMNLTVDYIPSVNQRVVLCYTCNSTRGGTMTSLGRSICSENAELLCQAAKTLNLNLVGFDVICEDIEYPIKKSRGFIIEANHNPDITICEAPLAGIPVPAAKTILCRLIRKHPIAYVWTQLKNLLSPYFFCYKILGSLLFIFGFVKLFLTYESITY